MSKDNFFLKDNEGTDFPLVRLWVKLKRLGPPEYLSCSKKSKETEESQTKRLETENSRRKN